MIDERDLADPRRETMVAEIVRDGAKAPSFPAIQVQAENVGSQVEERADSAIMEARPAERFVRLNVLIALLTFADGVLESLIYDDFSLIGFSAIFVAPFVLFAWSLRGTEADVPRWLRISGWTCVALAGTCVLSGGNALLSTPMDVACVVMSAGFFGLLGVSGLVQLKAARKFP
jgi:hypothetical protein